MKTKCPNCDGKKWFDSAIGLVACQVCNGTGVASQRTNSLKTNLSTLRQHNQQLREALIPLCGFVAVHIGGSARAKSLLAMATAALANTKP